MPESNTERLIRAEFLPREKLTPEMEAALDRLLVDEEVDTLIHRQGRAAVGPRPRGRVVAGFVF